VGYDGFILEKKMGYFYEVMVFISFLVITFTAVKYNIRPDAYYSEWNKTDSLAIAAISFLMALIWPITLTVCVCFLYVQFLVKKVRKQK